MGTFHHQKPLPPISFLPARVKGVFLCETFLDPPKLGRVPLSSPPPQALSTLDCNLCLNYPVYHVHRFNPSIWRLVSGWSSVPSG